MKKELLHINNFSKNRGFSLVELMVAFSIFLVFVSAIFTVASISVKQVRHAVNVERATALAEEGLEASRNIRDQDFDNLNNGTYGLSSATSEWEYVGTSDDINIFNREINIVEVDSDQKRIEVNVAWDDSISTNNTVSVASYLTNWRKYVPPAGLTIQKNVINYFSSAGVADFSPYEIERTVGTTTEIITLNLGDAVESPSGTFTFLPLELAPDVYTVSETIDPDYTQTFGGDCDSSGIVNLASGDSKICTITNEEKYAELTVNKVVVNNNGGTKTIADFEPYKVDTTTVIQGIATKFPAGTYIVSETPDPGYTANFGGDCNVSGSVTLLIGDSKVCTITNIDDLLESWANPAQQSSLEFAGTNDGLKVQVVGSYAYIVRNDGTPDFVIVNISNPASPTLTGSLSLTGIPTNVFVSGNYAYVSNQDDSSELQIINISNPSAPSVTGTFNAAGNANANGVYVVGTTAYIVRTTSADNEFVAINVSNPAVPTLTGSLDLADTGYEVYVSGNSAFVASANNSQELQVINIANPATPSIIGSNNISGNNDAITISGFGSYVFLGRTANMYTYDISNPASPALLSLFNGAGTVNDIALNLYSGNTYVFITTGTSNKEFEVVNISNPAAPVSVGGLNLTAYNGIAYDPINDRAVLVGPNDPELIITTPQ